MKTIPEYIEVRNNLTGKPVAFLSPQADGLKNCWFSNEQNGPCTLTFELPTKSEKWAYLTDAYRIIAEGKEFVIITPDGIKAERRGLKTKGKVLAHESWILLRKKFRTVSNDPNTPSPAWAQVVIVSGGAAAGSFAPGSAGSALTYLLEGSGWTVGTVDVDGSYDLETEKQNLLANVKKVQEKWGGIFIWDSLNHIVHLRNDTYQPYNGFQMRYKKNLKDIVRHDDYDIVTRLYPFGKDNLDISSVEPGGNIFISNNDYSAELFEDTYIDQSISDPHELYDKGVKKLAIISRPRHTYKAKILDLRTKSEFGHEDFTVSDMADVIDEELGEARIRIIRHAYNVFQPWDCEIDIGDPQTSLVAMISDSSTAAKYIESSVRPNTGMSNLLKGIVDTFATQVNGATGAFDVVDGVATWREKDAQGNLTGRQVIISPGGIAVSLNGGVNTDTVMTAMGLVARAFFAISSSDGFTKLIDSGLVVYDNADPPNLRLHVGQHTAGKFGIRIIDPNGSETILDENGILQTWQEGRTDNVDGTHPLVLNIFVPAETKAFKKALLRFKRQKFRAYETGAASGGGYYDSTSSASGGGSTSGGASWWTDSWYTSGISVTDLTGEHNHGIAEGTRLMVDGGGTVGFVWSGDHRHSIDGVDHAHYVYSHTHNFTIDIPNHTHSIVYGIYEAASLATGVKVKINGTDRTAALGGGTGFTADQNGLAISSYLTIGQWNTIELTPTNLSRIDATVFIQAMMGA